MLERISVGEIMRRAWGRGIVIPAFNIAYLPMLEPIARELKRAGTFGLVEVARPDVEKFGAESFARVAREYRRCAEPEWVRLHQDHIPAIDEDGLKVDWKALIQEALDLGYDSVMIDGSRLPLEENIAVTRSVVELAHARGVAVEAELGAVLGHEKGPLPPYEELFRTGRGFTRVEEAERFVRETGVDWLSVAVGNIHGAISEAARDKKKLQARIEIAHLSKLREATGLPLVLHGGSGIEKSSVLEAIKNGIAKINIGTEIRQAYESALKMRPGDTAFAREAVTEKVRWMISEYFGIEGSAGKLL